METSSKWMATELSWMSYATHLATVRQFYPKAVTTENAIHRLLEMIEHRLCLKPHQLMLAESMCCDDVNAMQYPPQAREMLGPFSMGGLGGFPFAGITGMKAFADHVPEDGAAVIFYAPHIGISKNGKIGEIRRVGQYKNTLCCGAVQGALSKLMLKGFNMNKTPYLKGGADPLLEEVDPLDYQMNTIMQILSSRSPHIMAMEHPIVEATQVLFEEMGRFLDGLIAKTKFPCEHIILVGGIFINSDAHMKSYCTYQRFEHLNIKTNKKANWLDNFFV